MSRIEGLRRIIFFVIIKGATYNALIPLYIFDTKWGAMMMVIMGLISNTCIYYVFAPKSKCGYLWGLVHNSCNCMVGNVHRQ